MSIQTVNAEILAGNFTNEQLGSIIDAVKFARARLAETNKRALTLGSKVQFNSSKTGQTLIGTVDKIAIKYVTVRTSQGLWRVPASMLTAVVAREYA
jgi:exosome complex RNA-binding protein Csl4